VPFLPDVYKEIAEVEAYVARKGRADARAQSITPEAAARINAIAEYHPHLSADALMALGRSGYGPLDKPTGLVSNIAAKLLLRDHPGGRMYGAPSMTPGQRRLLTEGSHAEWSWSPQSGDTDAWAAWEQARTSGLVSQGVLTEPTGKERKAAYGTYLNVLRRLTAAGEEVPVMVAGSPTKGDYTPKLARRGEEVAPGPMSHERNVSAGEAGQHAFNQALSGISFGDIGEQPAPTPGAGMATGQVGGGIVGHTPVVGSAQRAVEADQQAQARGQYSGVTALRDVIRGGAMAGDVGIQELQGQVRNLYGVTHGKDVNFFEPQSDLGITLTSGIDDAGTGFFVDPESEVATERRRREAERGQIGGHNVTLGRWVADATPLATDSKPSLLLSGLVDLGVAVKGDPAAWALSKIGKIGEGRRLFQAADLAGEESAGVIRGLRLGISGKDAEQFLDSPEGIDRVQWLAGETSPYKTWLGLNRKVTFDDAARFADTTDPAEVRALLSEQLGRSIREVSTVSMPFGGRSPLARAPTEMPSRGPINEWDKDIVGSEMERWLHNIGADTNTIAHHVDRVARAETPLQLNASIRQSLREADGILERGGVKDPRLRDDALSLHLNAHEEASNTYKATMTDQTPTYNMLNVAGVPVHDAGAHLYVEHAPQYITLPDARRLKRLTSKYPNIMTGLKNQAGGELRIPFALAESFQNEIWKPVQLATRFAWPIRVIGEEQIRMAAAGYDSMFKHPISHLADVFARKPHTELVGDLIEDGNAFKDSMTRTTGGGLLEHAALTGVKTTYHKGARGSAADKFLESWASEHLRLHGDPVARYVANADSLEEAKTWFTRGAGNKFRADLAEAHPGKYDSLEQADAYIETVAQRLAHAHGHDADLIEAIRTGKLNGEPLLSGTRLNRKVVKAMEGKVDQFAPDSIIGEEMHTIRGRPQSQVVQSWDRAVDAAFGFLMTKPSNALSRAPTFRQEYWRESERLIPFGDEDTKAAIIAKARDAGVSRRVIKRMERARPTGGALSLEEVDVWAKGRALDQTKELLYDLSRKGRFFDAARVVMPFGEAWHEVVTRWFGANGLVWQHPQTVRRFQQLVQGARGEDTGKLLGGQDGQGFFWTNEFGEEVFIYPGSQLLNQALVGVPVPLTGRVQGLSMFGTIMPGLGPVVQIPVGWFLASKPGPDALKKLLTTAENTRLGPLGTVKEQILPFGAVGAEDQGDIFNVANYVPPWIKAGIDYMTDGDLNEQAWTTSVMETAAYLRTTGDYGNSVGEQNRLMDDAQSKARGLYLIKSLTGNVVPASPDFEFMVRNDRGDLLRASALSQELRDMRDPKKGGDPETAGQRFLDKYGTDIYAVIATPKTTSSEIGTPTTAEGVAWVHAHPGVVDALPHTFGLFAPAGGDDDLSLYRENIRTGRSIRLNPKTWIRLQQDTLGDLLWAQAKAQVGNSTTKAEQDWLNDVADGIRAEHPGWGDEAGTLNKANEQIMVDELYRAVDNPDLAGTDAVKGLRLYLMARDKALAFAQDNGVEGFDKANSMADTRLWLNDIATEIVDLHPDFAPIWDFVLSHETRD
jgi:hypothetical protein